MDVLTAYASSIPHQPGERDCAVQLLEHLGAQRQKQAKKLHNAQRRHAVELRRRLKRSSHRLEKVLPQNVNGNPGAAGASVDLAASALKLLSDLGHPARLSRRTLHSYRIRVKELRNLLQMAQSADQQPFVERLGEVCDSVGEWHDWDELLAMAKKVLRHGTTCELISELRRIGDAKYRSALTLSEAMRKEFLRVSKRHRRTSAHGTKGPTASVWAATSALSW
jgi:CHAD domain-containing protein